jgi:hypothetical protein
MSPGLDPILLGALTALVAVGVIAITVPKARKVALVVLGVIGTLGGIRLVERLIMAGRTRIKAPSKKDERARVRDEDKAVKAAQEKAEEAAPERTTPPEVGELVERANSSIEARANDESTD